MMNLLIAILGDTYGSFIGSETLANNYEKALLIVDYENMLSNKEKKKLAENEFKGFLFFGEIPQENLYETERMRDKVEILEDNVRDFDDNTDDVLEETREDIKENLESFIKEQNKLKFEISEYKNEISSDYNTNVLNKIMKFLVNYKSDLEK